MTEQEEFHFLNTVRDACSNSCDADIILKVVSIALQALASKGQRARDHAVDMETIAYLALNNMLFKDNNAQFISKKLGMWKQSNALNWDEQIEKLKAGKS